MSKRIKDTEYLFLSTRIRVRETALLTRERMDRMLEAATDADAVRVLVECGYPEITKVDVDGINAAIAAVRNDLFRELHDCAPDPRLIDVFKMKYDYHNAKTLLKSEAMNADPSRLMVDVGRYPAKKLAEQFREKNYKDLSPLFAEALKQARDILAASRDPQLSDFALDKAYFREMEQMAKEANSSFLLGYVQRQVDAANLKSVVRVLRMKKNSDYLQNVLFEGGTVSTHSLLRMAENGDKLETVYGSTIFSKAAEEGQAAIAGGGLTTFERSCDNAIMAYVSGAKFVPFGEAVVVGYLAAKENELTAVRIIMTGRLAGLKADLIRERLRDAYV
ncbi:MAG: V-type ATPase subunit [Oscillospiraceae bacterium]|nr:V-type ATPase subunit [Oscillospiraceae bacterium]